MTAPLDSHGFVKRLAAAGMPEPRALAGEHTRGFEDALATKADLAPLAKATELRAIALRLASRLEPAKSDVLKWKFGALGFQTLARVGAVLALARALP